MKSLLKNLEENNISKFNNEEKRKMFDNFEKSRIENLKRWIDIENSEKVDWNKIEENLTQIISQITLNASNLEQLQLWKDSQQSLIKEFSDLVKFDLLIESRTQGSPA